jgi:hypothetical protein
MMCAYLSENGVFLKGRCDEMLVYTCDSELPIRDDDIDDDDTPVSRPLKIHRPLPNHIVRRVILRERDFSFCPPRVQTDKNVTNKYIVYATASAESVM